MKYKYIFCILFLILCIISPSLAGDAIIGDLKPVASTSGNVEWFIKDGKVVVDYTLDSFSVDKYGNQYDGTVVAIYRRGYDPYYKDCICGGTEYGYYDISEVEWMTTDKLGQVTWDIPKTGMSKAPDTYYYAKVYRPVGDTFADGSEIVDTHVSLINADTRKVSTVSDVLSVTSGLVSLVSKTIVPKEIIPTVKPTLTITTTATPTIKPTIKQTVEPTKTIEDTPIGGEVLK